MSQQRLFNKQWIILIQSKFIYILKCKRNIFDMSAKKKFITNNGKRIFLIFPKKQNP